MEAPPRSLLPVLSLRLLLLLLPMLREEEGVTKNRVEKGRDKKKREEDL